MSIQRNTDWVDHIIIILCILFVWFCVSVVKTAKAHHDELQQPAPVARDMYPEIPQCDKELWLRITEGCN